MPSTACPWRCGTPIDSSPIDNRLGVDVSYEQALEIRLQRALDVVALLLQCRLATPGLGVLEVEIAGESELRRRGLWHSLLEVEFPGFRLASRAKAPL